MIEKDYKSPINVVIPIISVISAAALAYYATYSALGVRRDGNKVKTVYNSVIGESEYQPPNWVFSVVWAVIYIGYAIGWSLINYKVKNPNKVLLLNTLFVIGILLNAGWSTAIIFANNAKTDDNVKMFHNISTVILLGIFLHTIILTFSFMECLYKYSPLGYGWIWVFSIPLIVYVVWSLIASFLSYNSPKLK